MFWPIKVEIDILNEKPVEQHTIRNNLASYIYASSVNEYFSKSTSMSTFQNQLFETTILVYTTARHIII